MALFILNAGLCVAFALFLTMDCSERNYGWMGAKGSALGLAINALCLPLNW